MDFDEISNVHPAGTIVCILCKGVISFSNNDKSLFYKHIGQHHNVHFYHNFVMAINFLDKDTMVRIEDEFEKSLTVEVTDDEMKDNDELDISQETLARRSEETLAIEWKGTELIKGKENLELENKRPAGVKNTDLFNLDLVQSGSGVFHCNKCAKAFKSSRVFENHIILHSKEIQVKCDMCSKSFTSKDDLRKHTKKYHKPVIDKMTKPFSCNECPSLFSLHKYLKTHIKNKHRLFIDKTSCESKIDLKCPVSTSEKCHIRGKVISHPDSLSKHLLSHKGKPFSCEVCGNSFSKKNNLKRHKEHIHGIDVIKKEITSTIKPQENTNQNIESILPKNKSKEIINQSNTPIVPKTKPYKISNPSIKTVPPIIESPTIIKPNSNICDQVAQKSPLNNKLEGKTFTDPSLPKGWRVNEYTTDGQTRRRYLSPEGDIFNSRKSLVEHMRSKDTFTDKDIKKVMFGFVVS